MEIFVADRSKNLSGLDCLCQTFLELCNDRRLLAAVTGCIGATVTVSWVLARRKKEYLNQKLQKKRRECQESLQQLRDSLSMNKVALAKESHILEFPVIELLNQLKACKLRPIEVLEAYQRAALKAHDKTNCLIEPIKEAATWARKLESEPKGPLYGLPIVLKDDHCVKGYDSTVGCVQLIGKPAQEDCVHVKALKAAGAIPFMKTNVPLTMISYESSNAIFGMTVNAHDPARGAGGSSGGTAALLGAGGALVGTGSDLGGSIRVPAAFNGVCGFKPTPNRIREIAQGMDASYGVLSRSVAGSVVFMRALWSGTMFKEEPDVSPIPFQEEVFTSIGPLRIGYFIENGVFPLPPAYRRAVLMAKAALEKCGHKVFPYKTNSAMNTCTQGVFLETVGDGGKLLYNFLKDDIVDERALGTMPMFLGLPTWIKKLLPRIINLLPERFRLGALLFNVIPRSLNEWWAETAEIKKKVHDIHQDWKANRLDGILCPAFGTHALPVGSTDVLYTGYFYPVLFNVLSCPAGVVPVTTVTQQDEDLATDIPETDFITKILKKGMKNSVGLPIGVQCATLPYRDEVCLRLMADIERKLE